LFLLIWEFEIMGKGDPVLYVRKLSVCYGRRPVIFEVTFSVTMGQIVALVGPNGAGKTSILKAISGLIRPVEGEIIFLGRHVEKLGVCDIVRLGIVYVPEGTSIFPHMSVEENLEVGAYLHRENLSGRLDYVYSVFPELKDKRLVNASALSGGEQRMVTIGRGLMANSRLLLLDDPFLGLSPKATDRFCEAFHILREDGITLLVAGQHVRRLLSAADWAFLIENGHITLTGAGKDLLKNEHLQQVLFGKVSLILPGLGFVD